jgi:hypothetical protein
MEYDIYYSLVKFEVLRSSGGGAIPEMVVVVGLPEMINFARVPVLSAGGCTCINLVSAQCNPSSQLFYFHLPQNLLVFL